MSDLQNSDMLLDHEYDEIKEYDNPLPTWWSWIFAMTCAFSVCYVFWFHIGLGPSIHEEHDADVAAHVEKLLAQLGDIRPDNATILEFMGKDDWMAASVGTFVGNCGQCHLGDGGGNIGPNLTDDFYKNVSEPADIFTVITEGVPNTGMTAWGDRLSEPQRILLAAYVARLRGTQPAKSKEAEGTRIADWNSTVEVAGADDDGA